MRSAKEHVAGLRRALEDEDYGDLISAAREAADYIERTAAPVHVLNEDDAADLQEGRPYQDVLAAKRTAAPVDLPLDRDTLGRMVREAWVRWAKTQPNPKASWLLPYDDLSEPDQEADRQIGEAIAKWTTIHEQARASLTAPAAPADLVLETTAEERDDWRVHWRPFNATAPAPISPERAIALLRDLAKTIAALAVANERAASEAKRADDLAELREVDIAKYRASVEDRARLIAERDREAAARREAEGKYRDEYAIVDRIWKALGVTTYEGADGREISEIVADWKARAEQAEAREATLRAAQSQAAVDVLAERRRQIEAEGWSPEHDDAHDKGEMAAAAVCYAFTAVRSPYYIGHIWPWSSDWWKPKDPRRDLVKAGALILAEIERRDRAALATNSTAGGE